MRKLNQVIPNLSTQREQDYESAPDSTEPDSTRADVVWLQLVDIYGRAMFREHGETPGRLWVEAINRLSDDEVKRGLMNLASDGLAFPPNLGQFVAACKHVKELQGWSNSHQRATWGVKNHNMTLLEDHRPSGKMSYAEWKKKEGIV